MPAEPRNRQDAVHPGRGSMREPAGRGMALRTRVLIGLVRGAWSRLVCFDRPISSPSRAPRSRPVAFLLHGAIARVVGVGLVVLPGLLERTGTARNFRLAAGPVTLGMCVLFRYRAAAAAVA